MEVALITGAFLLVAAYAVFEAWMDFGRIAAHEPIDHVEGWTIRAVIVSVIWLLAYIKIDQDAIPCAIGSAFLFSAVFRYCLNRMRGMDCRYLSPSSWYDWQFLRLTHAGYDGQRDDAIEWHGRRYGPLLLYARDVHRAGTIAYAFEVVILAVCIFIAA